MENRSPWSIQLLPETPLLAQQLGGAVQLGAGFAYLREDLGQHVVVRKLARPLGLRPDEDAPRMICLWGEGQAQLPGATVERSAPPHWSPAALWADRSAYHHGESVHVVLLTPGCPLPSARVSLGQSESHARGMDLALNNGAGHLELRGLPPGRWRVRCQLPWPDPNKPRGLQVRFVVLETRLLPLSARWLMRRVLPGRSGGQRKLLFAVGLESFGEPAQGPTRVWLENARLREREILHDQLYPDSFGVVRGEVALQGAGPFVLMFELRGATRRTAQLSVPLHESDHELLQTGDLVGDGVLRTARLEEHSTALGLHVVPSESACGPLLLDARSQHGQVRVLARESCDAAALMLMEPLSGGFQVYELGQVARGEERTFQIKDSLGIAVMGAQPGHSAAGQAQPWEAWGVWATQDQARQAALSWGAQVQPDPELPEGDWAEAGARPTLHIQPAACSAQAPAPLLVLVTHQDDPDPPGAPPGGALEALGQALLDHLRELLERLEPQAPLPTLFEAAGAEAALQDVLRALQGRPEPPRRPRAAPRQLEEDAPPLPVEGREVRPLLVRILAAEEPVELRLPSLPSEGRVQVQVIDLSGGAWSLATSSLRCGAPVGVHWHLPAFVNPGDQAQGRLELRCWGQPAALWLSADGVPVPVTLRPDHPDGEPTPLEPGQRLPTRARLEFDAAPGRWSLVVAPWREGSDAPPPDPWIHREGVVSVAGRAIWLTRHVRCLQAGERAPRGLLRPLQVLPDLEPLLRDYLRAIQAATWETCESLAAQVLGLAITLLMGPEEPEAFYQSLMRACSRLRALFVAGVGWSARDPAGPPDQRLGQAATRHLLRLGSLLHRLEEHSPLHQRARVLLEGAVHMGQRAATLSGMVLPLPVESVHNADDADLLWRQRPERLAVAAATARARLKRRASARDLQEAPIGRRSEPEARAERAFAARVLLETGEEADRALALEALALACQSSLRGPLAPLGGWSTMDSVAVALVLFEALERPWLRSAGLARLGDQPQAQELEEPRLKLHALEVIQGQAWITWEDWQEDDLSDPASLLPMQVFLHRRGSRTAETRFQIGDLLELDVDLGLPPQGGARPGDWLEVHLPASLAPVPWPGLHAERGGRLLRINMEGRQRLTLNLRAVSTTGAMGRQPAAQHFAVALRNMDDPRRGRGMLGLDVTVVDAADFAERLRRGVQDLLR